MHSDMLKKKMKKGAQGQCRVYRQYEPCSLKSYWEVYTVLKYDYR